MFGLLQHEAKLSVLNFGVRKAAAFEDPLPNKAPLLLVTGVRFSYLPSPLSSASKHTATRPSPLLLQVQGIATALLTLYGDDD